VTDKTYHVVVTHENGAWLADVPALAGTHTFARNIPSLQKAVRELIALVEDLPDGAEDHLDVDYEYRIGIPEVEAETRQLRADRERIRREEDDLARRTDAAAKTLVDRYRFSVRDAAALTGVSKQRISQLAPGRRTAKPAIEQAAAVGRAGKEPDRTGTPAPKRRGSRATRATAAAPTESSASTPAARRNSGPTRSSGAARSQPSGRTAKAASPGRAPEVTGKEAPERKAR
jgi:hypothetical protein